MRGGLGGHIIGYSGQTDLTQIEIYTILSHFALITDASLSYSARIIISSSHVHNY